MGMRIGIDARQIIVNERGISNYICNLVENLLRIDAENQYYLYINSAYHNAMGKDDRERKLKGFREFHNARIIDLRSKGNVLWEQVFLPLNALVNKIDILHMTSNSSPAFCRSVLVNVIHDVIEMTGKRPCAFKTLKGRFYEWRVRQYIKFTYNYAFKKSDLVITISEVSKNAICNTLGIDDLKVKVIFHGIESMFRPLGLEKKYILTLGQCAEQKNPEGPFEAYSYLAPEIREKYPLMVVGITNDEKIEGLVEKYGLKNVVMRGFVSQDELVKLYNEAVIFLYLSVEEGFGLPPLEGMACGTPPIVYNRGPMKDNVNNANLCVEFKNNKEVARKIEILLGDKVEYNEMVVFGLNRAKEFSWEKCAGQYLDTYRSLFAAKEEKGGRASSCQR